MNTTLTNLTELVADGYFWHKLSDKMRVKYGTDWSHKLGFNFSKLTKVEKTAYINVYTATMTARGIAKVNINF